MPRNIRNSFVKIQIDGRENINTGPRSADGEMSAHFLVRSRGSIVDSVTVQTSAREDGTLSLVVFAPNGEIVYEQRTVR